MVNLLNDDYEFDSRNIIDFTSSDEIGDFKLIESDFMPRQGKTIKKQILKKETDTNIYQIFKMNDGKYILEIEELFAAFCKYYESDNLLELINYN